MVGLEFMNYQSNEDIEHEEQESAKKDAELRQNNPVLTSLSSYVRSCWEAARRAKEDVKDRMLKSLRSRNGEYEPDKLSEIRKMGGSEIYMMLTDEKCNAAESWIEDLLISNDVRPFAIKKSNTPKISQEQEMAITQRAQMMVQQDVQEGVQMGMYTSPEEVRSRVEEMAQDIREMVEDEANKQHEILEEQVEDHAIQAKWRDAFISCLWDFTTYPTCVMKGPIYSKGSTMVWGQDGRPAIQPALQKRFERVDPFNVYPAPSARGIDDGYLIERHSLTRRNLQALRGVDGYDTDAINMVLQEYGQGGLQDWLSLSSDTEQRQLQDGEFEDDDPEGRIEALQFWGSVQGIMLLEYGMTPNEIDDPLDDYDVEVWLIGNYVIKAEINGDSLGRKPYFKASFRDRKGQFWGYSLADLIRDIQDMCNASARNLVNNMSISSGPQVGIDVGNMPEDEDVTDLYPWKIHQFDMSTTPVSRQPIWFFQPNSNVDELLKVYEFFSKEADNKSGIPKYSYGDNVKGGAAGTATGFSMLMQNATKGIKKVVRNIDLGLTEPSINRLIHILMIYERDFNYAGDIQVYARGAGALIAKEQQQVRRNELLQMVLQSEVAQQIIGFPGVAELFRETVKGLDVNADDVVPSEEEVRRRQRKQQIMQRMAAMQQQGQQMQQSGQMQKSRQVDAAGNVSGGRDANQHQDNRR